MTYEAPLYSPAHHYHLQLLDGEAGTIETGAKRLETLGSTMTSAARSLSNISKGKTQISDAVDKVREEAGDVHADLTKAGERYSKTGSTLRAYATALAEAQRVIGPLVPKIEDADADRRAGQATLAEAEGAQRDLKRVWLWEDEPTDAQLQSAADDVSDAQGSVDSAQGRLDDLWPQFERAFGDWASAYETAVHGVETAIAEADNNDSWWDDAIDVFIDAIGWVAMGLAIVAIFVAAPLAGILLAVVAVLTVVSLIGHIYLMTKGRASWSDIAFDIVGLIPFVKPLAGVLRAGGTPARMFGSLAMRLTPAAATNAMGQGRRTLWESLRRGFTGPGGRRGAQQYAGQRTGEIVGTVEHNARWVWNSIRGGHRSYGDFPQFIANVTTGASGQVRGMSAWLRSAQATTVMPSRLQSVFNVGGFTAGLDPVFSLVPGYGDIREKY